MIRPEALAVECLEIDHHTEPLGFMLPALMVAWKVRGSTRGVLTSRIRVWSGEREVWDSGEGELDNLGTVLPIQLHPRTAYQWQVTVRDEQGNHAHSEVASFETGKLDEPWNAQWIGAPRKETPILVKRFSLDSVPPGSRLYATGLGLYEAEVNGRKLGDEFMLPGCCVYDHHVMYQTFDLDGYLRVGENEIRVRLADGWYMGRFGMDGRREHYGNHYAFLAEMHIGDAVIATDASWLAGKSDVVSDSIYDGECWKPGEVGELQPAVVFKSERHSLMERIGSPLRIQTYLQVQSILPLGKGKFLLDFGQNMAGFVRFECDLPAGAEVVLRYAEHIQDGKLFTDNLGAARQEYRYISDGLKRAVEPRFTYYGFRYVEVSGWPDVRKEQFTACALWSDMKQIGFLKLHDPLMDRLVENVLWGQRSNYVDIPTDCPQRAERLGWTGDAQVFAGAACYLTDCVAFLDKFCTEMRAEQAVRNGAIPFYVPAFGSDGVCAFWGDAGVLLPWRLYVRTGDVSILQRCWPGMRAWVDYVRQIDETSGATGLWHTGFQFGDWLALDDLEDGDGFKGATDDTFIASVCYMKSAGILGCAAGILGLEKEKTEYARLSEKVRNAIRAEYFTPNGALAIRTQTAYALALEEGLSEKGQEKRLIEGLMAQLQKAGMHLRTGFVGTPCLMRALSRNGMHDVACRLFTRKDPPGWLNEVLLGATTVWERWNSILPDGHINPAGMNSLNHYSYGSVVEWLYEDVAGIRPDPEHPGFRHAFLQPRPHWRLPCVDMIYDSASGRYAISFQLHADNRIILDVTVPLGATATLKLPGMRDSVHELSSGSHHFDYIAEECLTRRFNADTSVDELAEFPEVRAILEQNDLSLDAIPPSMRKKSLRELSFIPFTGINAEMVKTAELALTQIS